VKSRCYTITFHRQYRYLLRQQGVEVIYISAGFTGSDADELILPVQQWQARQELKDLAKVTIRGLKSRTEKGRWNGGTPPYGYAGGDDVMIVGPWDETPLLRRLVGPDGGDQPPPQPLAARVRCLS